MKISFSSQRLVVSLIKGGALIDPAAITEILSQKATAHLPDSWQNISDEQLANAWLKERLTEGQVYGITLKDSQSLIGFLFLYGMSFDDKEIRIGYVLSESHWGKGLATELINGLIVESKKQDNIATLVGGVSRNNMASAKALTKNGFTLVSVEQDTEYYQYRFE